LTIGEKGVIIIKLSDERTSGKAAGAARKESGEDRERDHEKVLEKTLRKSLTNGFGSDIILKLSQRDGATEKKILKKLLKRG
jgi:hypothetical protein